MKVDLRVSVALKPFVEFLHLFFCEEDQLYNSYGELR